MHRLNLICYLNHIKKRILEVHPNRKTAKDLYDSLGMVKIGTNYKNDNFNNHKSLSH